MSFTKLLITKIATKKADATRVEFNSEYGGTVSGEISGFEAESTVVYASDTPFITVPGSKKIEGKFEILQADTEQVRKQLAEFAGELVDSVSGEIKYLTISKTVEVALAFYKVTSDGKVSVDVIPRATIVLSPLTYATLEETNTLEGYEISFKGLPITDETTGDNISVVSALFANFSAPEVQTFVDKYHYRTVTDLLP